MVASLVHLTEWHVKESLMQEVADFSTRDNTRNRNGGGGGRRMEWLKKTNSYIAVSFDFLCQSAIPGTWFIDNSGKLN